MRILILTWRDLAHPQAGGAEVYTEQVARRWVADGHDVTLFATADSVTAATLHATAPRGWSDDATIDPKVAELLRGPGPHGGLLGNLRRRVDNPTRLLLGGIGTQQPLKRVHTLSP